MDNADKFADKWNFKKVKCPQTLANAGGLAGAGAEPLHIHDDARDLGHGRVADVLLHQ